MTTNQSVSRRHHYLTQAYLAAFTDTGLKDGYFFVLDIDSGNSFKTSPLNVATRRDFNRVDIDGHPPDVIENALAPFEAEAVNAIRRVISSEEFPSDSDFNLILNFICLNAVRNPLRRNSFNLARANAIHQMGELLVSDEKIWRHHIKQAEDAGIIKASDISFEEMKVFIDERQYEIEFLPEGNLGIEFRTFDKLLPVLNERIWSVLIAPPDGPEFVCSDHPVALSWKKKNQGPVGFGLTETEVFFPLGRRVGLYGVYEDAIKKVVKLQPDRVALFNSQVTTSAERHVFSTLDTFSIWHEGKRKEVSCDVRTG